MVAMLLDEQLDMVVGTRKHEVEEAYRGGHVLGNKLFTGLLAGLFGRSFSDIFSGYRVFSRRFVKSFPVLSRASRSRPRSASTRSSSDAGRRGRHRLRRPAGRLGVQAVDLPRRLADPEDDPHALPDRAAGAVLRRLRRLPVALAIVLAVPLVITYLETGLVPRFPTAILVTGLIIVAVLCFFAGLILDTVVRGRREVRRLAYLSSSPARASAATRSTRTSRSPSSTSADIAKTGLTSTADVLQRLPSSGGALNSKFNN
jgi:hypothetical protein